MVGGLYNFLKDRVVSKVKERAVETTAVITLFTPLLATIETRIAEMTNHVSIKSRIGNGLLNFLTIPLILEGREYSKSLFKITEQTPERTKKLHDSLYASAVALITKPAVYIAAGESDWQKILLGTGIGMAIGYVIGSPVLYFVDVFKDLVGIKASERTPKWINKFSKNAKKRIAAGIIVASLGLTALIYSLNHNFPNSKLFNIEKYQKPAVSLEYKVEKMADSYTDCKPID